MPDNRGHKPGSSDRKPLQAVARLHECERLNGENGLLLTPSIDHLFDRGFIGFEGNGNLIISPVAHRPSLDRMGIDTTGAVHAGSTRVPRISPGESAAEGGAVTGKGWPATTGLVLRPSGFIQRAGRRPHGINVVRDFFRPSGAMVAG